MITSQTIASIIIIILIIGFFLFLIIQGRKEIERLKSREYRNSLRKGKGGKK